MKDLCLLLALLSAPLSAPLPALEQFTLRILVLDRSPRQAHQELVRVWMHRDHATGDVRMWKKLSPREPSVVMTADERRAVQALVAAFADEQLREILVHPELAEDAIAADAAPAGLPFPSHRVIVHVPNRLEMTSWGIAPGSSAHRLLTHFVREPSLDRGDGADALPDSGDP